MGFIDEYNNEIKVDLKKLVEDNPGYSEKDFEDAARIFNTIAWGCKYRGLYSEGMRNDIAVDLSIASYVLGLDPYEVMKLFIREGAIDVEKDDESTVLRFDRIEPYLPDWCDGGYFRDYLTQGSYWIWLNYSSYECNNGDIYIAFV